MDGTPDDNFSLSSVFSQSYFIIPEYQRDYAWEESNIEDLLDDIEFVYEQNEKSNNQKLNHYFGTFVLEERGSTEPNDFEEYDLFGIVDGQQRLATIAIVISAIVDEMAKIESSSEVNKKISSKINDRIEDIKQKYIQYEGTERVKLGGLAEEAYNDIILEGIAPEEYLQKNDTVETEDKVANAKHTVRKRLINWQRQRFTSESLNHAAYYKFLKVLVRTLTQRFEVNIKVVEDVDEAARMFKVINDRGRDLRLHDKVRSHLVYCASRSDEISSKRIYNQFNSIVQNITIHDGLSDNEVDDLIRIHWEVFTSERSDSRSKRSGPLQIHRRLSDIYDFANIQRDDYEKFIRPYLNSLENFSEKYPYLTDREKFAQKFAEPEGGKDLAVNKAVRKIQLMFTHAGSQKAVSPLLISIAEKFGVSSGQFADVVSELEKMVFGYSLVMSYGATGYRNTLASTANDLYWSDISDNDVSEIFNSKSERYFGYQSKELGIKESINRISKKAGRITQIDKVIGDFLSEPDVLEGSLTSGWGGIRNPEIIKYIMYEYEMKLRDQSGLHSLSPYHEFRENFEVEHLVPKNAEAGNKLQNHSENKHRIGNLAVLSSEQNKSKGNAAFENKYREIYRDSSLKVLRQLDGPNFSVDKIREREQRELLPFIKERWG